MIGLLSAPSVGQAWEPGDERRCPARGAYANGYGFRITLPPGLHGCPNSPVGMSDHGVAIPLDAARTRVIEAYAGYNATPYRNVHRAVSATLAFMGEYAECRPWVLLSRRRTRLGGLAAERVVLRCGPRGSGTALIHASTEALRRVTAGAAPSHTYSVSLSTTAEHYSEDRALLRQVLASWQTRTTDDDPEPAAAQ